MDHRSTISGTSVSPFRAVGIVGVLTVVAVAFALGVKAGRELEMLRGDGSERVSLPPKNGLHPKSPHQPETVAKRAPDGDPVDEDRGHASAGGNSTAPGAGPSAPGSELAPVTVAASPSSSTSIAAPSPSATSSGAAPPPAASQGASAYSDLFKQATGGSGVGSPAPVASAAGGAGKVHVVDTSGSADRGATDAKKPSAAGGASSPSVAKLDVKPDPQTKEAKKADSKQLSAAKSPSDNASNKASDKAARSRASAASAAAPTGKIQIVPDAAEPTAAPARGGYAVQVAAFSSQADAEQLATRLHAHGLPGAVTSTNGAAGPEYRVSAGKYKSAAEAKAELKKVSAAGFPGGEVHAEH